MFFVTLLSLHTVEENDAQILPRVIFKGKIASDQNIMYGTLLYDYRICAFVNCDRSPITENAQMVKMIFKRICWLFHISYYDHYIKRRIV